MRNDSRKWGTLVIGCLAMLMLSIDLTVLHLATPMLTEDLDPSAPQLLWIADVYGFVLAGLLVTMGNLGDRIGRRRLLLTGSAAFGVASLLTAYAPTPELLIAARALLGVAGATIMPSTLSLVRNVFTDSKERTTAVGIWSSVGAAGFALGPLVGGALLNEFWWGSVFLVNVPVIAGIVIAGLIVLPESRNPNPGRIDLVSVPMSIVGVIAIIYALKEAAHGGAGQTSVIVAAVLGVVTLGAFALRQTRLAEPLIDVQLFRNRAFSASVGSAMIAMFAMLAMSLIFAQYFQLVLGWSPLVAGLAGLPGGVGAGIGGAAAGPLISRLGRAEVVALGMVLAAVGFGLYSQVGTELSYPYLVVAMIVASTGIGLTFAVVNDTIVASAPRERAGAAAAISETATEMGGALGIAVLGTVLNSAYTANLALPAGLPAEAGEQVGDTLGDALRTAATLPADLASSVTGAAREAFVAGMQTTVLTGAGILVVLAAVALYALRGVPKEISDDVTELSHA
ncbi:MFS transporter [Planobispora siamensis]|uniref:MFS transporter n=1 Tax=Planobispora siamensis TaxID=936338 RepID=A0A8J3WIB3_9ACTN|nr:MFS transporter [Planobispora siamensis]GIH90393.1 MFS transporter [Planobispora siamensis]